MAYSLLDILADKNFDEPAEAVAIKRFVAETYQRQVGVTVRDRDILITADGAAFANTLRLQTLRLQQAAGTTKRLVFSIG